MEIRFTKPFLSKLEDLVAATGYILRYEKGQFRAGYCLLKDMKVAVVNQFFTTEGRVNALIDILKALDVNLAQLSDQEQELYQAIKAHSSTFTPEQS